LALPSSSRPDERRPASPPPQQQHRRRQQQRPRPSLYPMSATLLVLVVALVARLVLYGRVAAPLPTP
jgi:hypothetical protein